MKDVSNDVDPAMVAAAREIYLDLGGGSHLEIERRMRERGWKAFHRGLLYSRRRAGRIEKGWPALYGWKDHFKKERTTQKPEPVGTREFEMWLRTTFPEWNWGWRYQRFLYQKLHAVTTGKSKRLMIFMPPRHGKSETVTVRYTAWHILRDPKLNVILGSYNQRLADRFSRKIRRIVSEPPAVAGGLVEPVNDSLATKNGTTENTEGTEYTEKAVELWSESAMLNGRPQPPATAGGTDIGRRLSAISEWETPGGGVVRSVGVGGGIAGFGAGLIVIDDPVRNRADAESETYREKVWDWFNDDIYTRLEPDASIILIQTRWHEDDLAGRLLREAQDGGEAWDVVRLPAIAEGKSEAFRPSRAEEGARGRRKTPKGVTLTGDPIGRRPGQALCPKRYSVAALERIRKKLGSYSFSALYQQDPVPAKGGRFKREWFRQIVDEVPPGLRWKRGYDLAVSVKTSADYTASFRCAFDKQGNLYIADGFRKRLEFPDQRRYIIERMQSEPGTEHGIESAMHGKAVVQELRREPDVRQYAFREVRVDADKLTRALSWLNLAEAGKLFLVRGPWIDEFVDEVCRFPSARFDDQVDAVSIAVGLLGRSTGRGAAGF